MPPGSSAGFETESSGAIPTTGSSVPASAVETASVVSAGSTAAFVAPSSGASATCSTGVLSASIWVSGASPRARNTELKPSTTSSDGGSRRNHTTTIPQSAYSVRMSPNHSSTAWNRPIASSQNMRR